MSSYCFVPGCHSKKPNVRLFLIPAEKDKKKVKEWLQAIEEGTATKIDKKKFYPKSSRVCERHFRKEDFEVIPLEDGSTYMKRKIDSIPTVFENNQLFVDEVTSKKCRICLESQGTISIKNIINHSNVTVLEAVNDTFNFDFNSQIKFPQMVCNSCFKFIKTAYAFKEKILKSDVILHALANEIVNILNQPPKSEPIIESQIPQTITSSDANAIFIINEVIKEEPIEIEIKEEVFEENENIYEVPQTSFDVIEEKYPKKKSKSNDTPLTSQKSQKARYKCKKCGHETFYQIDLFKHIDNSSKNCIELYEPKNECFLCRKKFILRALKNDHVKNDHNDEKLTGECPLCKRFDPRSLKNPFYYERHIRSHIVPPDYVCVTCGQGFHKKASYHCHMNLHKDYIWFYCDYCGFRTKTKASMVAHLKKHSTATHSICDVCSKSVRDMAALKAHKFRIHRVSEAGCYYCQSCNFCFLWRHEYKKHLPKCNGVNGKKHPPDCVRIPRKDLDPSCQIRTL